MIFSFNLVLTYSFEVTVPTIGIPDFEQTIRQKVCTDLRYIAIFALTQGTQPGISALCTGTSTKENNRESERNKCSQFNPPVQILSSSFTVHVQSISEEMNNLECQSFENSRLSVQTIYF